MLFWHSCTTGCICIYIYIYLYAHSKALEPIQCLAALASNLEGNASTKILTANSLSLSPISRPSTVKAL